ncbi:MAG: lipid-binding SYLF domain-containing protein [Pseudomonadota bacterium]
MTGRWLWCAALLAAMLVGRPVQAADPQRLVNQAGAIVAEMRGDPRFTAADLLARSKAVMIVPELKKGGMLIGGQGGTGLLLVKQSNGGWSSPVFYSIGGATLGLQVGFETAKMVLLVMSDGALQAWLRGEFKFGGQDGNVVFLDGSEGSAGKTSQGADVVAWAHGTGAYAGITVEGTDFSFDQSDNRSYYGRILGAQDIIQGGAANPGADTLRQALAAP